jgi:hypothetical protein
VIEPFIFSVYIRNELINKVCPVLPCLCGEITL